MQIIRDFFVLGTSAVTAVSLYPEWVGTPSHFGVFGVALGLIIFSLLNLTMLLTRPAWRLYYFCLNSAVQIIPAIMFTTISLDYALMGVPMLLMNFAVLATLREKTELVRETAGTMPATTDMPSTTPAAK